MDHQQKDDFKEELNLMRVRIIFCDAHEDELFLDKLKSHLKPFLPHDERSTKPSYRKNA